MDENFETTENQPVDPALEMIDAITFGNPDQGAAKFKTAVAREFEAAVYQQVLALELAKTNREVAEFENKNPDLAVDSRTRNVVTADALDLQRAEVANSGFDLAAWEKTQGRAATSNEIQQWHRHYRAIRSKSFRSVGEILEAAADGFDEWRGSRRKSSIPDAAEALLERKNKIRALRGQPLLEKTEHVSSASDAPTATDESLESYTLRMSGMDQTDPDATREGVHPDRIANGLTGRESKMSSVVDNMRAARRAGRGPSAGLDRDR